MSGLHHVTAIAGDPIRNFGFYTRDLGLRYAKRTVNFDDPATYHFYYGDETGRPGTILTFFPWQGVPPGRRGVGETHQTAFRVPQRSLGYWTQRFLQKGIHYEALEKRFGESVLPFTDPDGMALALVGVPGAEDEPAWSNGDGPVEHAIRGFHGVTLLLDNAGKTAAVLTDVFGFKETAREGSVIRYKAAGDINGSVVDIYEAKGFLRRHQGGGSVHHIAFRAADDAEQGFFPVHFLPGKTVPFPPAVFTLNCTENGELRSMFGFGAGNSPMATIYLEPTNLIVNQDFPNWTIYNEASRVEHTVTCGSTFAPPPPKPCSTRADCGSGQLVH